MSDVAAAIDSVWDVAVKVPAGEQKSVVSLKSEGDKLVGYLRGHAQYLHQYLQDCFVHTRIRQVLNGKIEDARDLKSLAGLERHK